MRAPIRSGHDAHDVAFFHDQQLFAVDCDFCAGPFAEQNFVACFDAIAISSPLSLRAPSPRRQLRLQQAFLLRFRE